jgi:hypothetical protein
MDDIPPDVIARQTRQKLREYRVICELGHVLHRNQVGLNRFDKVAEARNERPFVFVARVSPAPTVSRKWLAWGASREQTQSASPIQLLELISAQGAHVLLNESCAVVRLERISALRVEINTRDDLYAAAH